MLKPIVCFTCLLISLMPARAAGQEVPLTATPFREGHEVVQGPDGESRRYAYRLLPPPAGAPKGKEFPLVVFLHGAGERGAENHRQLTLLGYDMAKAEWRQQFPCWFLAVQCPQGERWVEVDWGAKESTPAPRAPSPAMAAVEAAVQKIVQTEAVDLCRVYLTGLSIPR